MVLGNRRYRTRSCPSCGHRNDLHSLRALGKADSPQDAVALIQSMKKKEAEGGQI
ncbi:DUF1922 domain-containing protein [Candidatus Bathyarchaeota archaeon]|nr:DUF1922 domain-containing protein [Candidatus Bathyarchaeota archaeon]